MLHIDTVKYALAIKRNVTTLMDSEKIMLDEIKQQTPSHACMLPLQELCRLGKSLETKGRLVVARGEGKRIRVEYK